MELGVPLSRLHGKGSTKSVLESDYRRKNDQKIQGKESEPVASCVRMDEEVSGWRDVEPVVVMATKNDGMEVLVRVRWELFRPWIKDR